MDAVYQLNLNAESRPYPHYWELCVGSCHATTLLRADVQEQVKRAHEECGFRYIRFHGLFDDDMSVVLQNFFQIRPTYSFVNVDRIFDFLLRIGMKPFIELGFMPEALASDTKMGFHYKNNITMPRKDEGWTELIRRFTQHLLDRYGSDEVESWFFEVWNEPNLGFFFAGSRSDYFHLYQITSETIKAVNGKLRVGGPATSSNAWIPEFIEFCEKGQVPLDFVTTHHYPNDDPLAVYGEYNDATGMNFDVELTDEMKEQIAQAMMAGVPTNNPRDILLQMARKAKQEAGSYPLYYTEWNGSVEHDTNYMAAFVVQTLAYNENLVEGYSFWTVSDIFEEMGQNSAPYHDGFGMLNLYNIAKPVYRVFQELHRAGDRRLPVEGSDPNAEVLALDDGETVTVFLYNHDIARRTVAPTVFRLTLEGAADELEMAVIDETHCNPKAKWEALGSPEYPTAAQLAEIEAAAELPFQAVSLNEAHTIDIPAGVESVTILRVRRG